MELEGKLLERARNWESISHWERSELGRDLRRAGLSYGEIMAMVPVKKSTLATWCRDVTLTEEQITAIKVRTGTQRGIPRATNRRRLQIIEAIKAQAKLEALHLQDDPFWTLGLSLYWGEGTKASRRLELTNSEPEALRLFMAWTRQFHDASAAFGAAIHLHSINDEPSARRFWSQELEIPVRNFTKTFIKPEGTGHRKNRLQAGICRVTMKRSTDAWITTLAWIDFVKEAFRT